MAKFAKFLVLPVYAVLLTPTEFGMIVFLEAIILASGRFLSLGLHHAVKRYYVDFDSEVLADAYAANLWWASVAFAIVLGAALIGINSLYALAASVSAWHISLAITAGGALSMINLPLQRYIAREEAVRHGIWSSAPGATVAVLIAVVVIGGGGVTAVMVANIIGYGLWALAGGMAIGRETQLERWRQDVRSALRYSLPVMPHMLFTWGITFVDRILLERLVPLGQVATYGLGYQLASLIPVFSIAFVNAGVARFFRTADTVKGSEAFVGYALSAFSVIVVVAIGAMFLAPELIHIVGSGNYSESVVIMQLVAAALVFHGVYQMLLLPLFYRETTHLVSITTGIAFAMNVFANVLLIPRLGILGAALATLFAYMAAAGVAMILVYWAHPLPFPVRNVVLLACCYAMAVFSALHLASPIGQPLENFGERLTAVFLLIGFIGGTPWIIPVEAKARALRQVRRTVSKLSR